MLTKIKVFEYIKWKFTKTSPFFTNWGGGGGRRTGPGSAFEQVGIFIVSHLLWHIGSVLRSHPTVHPKSGLWRQAMGTEDLFSGVLKGLSTLRDDGDDAKTSTAIKLSLRIRILLLLILRKASKIL